MARSIFLRGFDQEIAELIASYMEKRGTKMIRPAVPLKFERTEDGKVQQGTPLSAVDLIQSMLFLTFLGESHL